MSRPFKLSILSDIHYAGPAEQLRPRYHLQGVRSPLHRLALKAYRRYLWLHDPFAHNHLLDRFIAQRDSPDLVIANGDYSCDTAFVGVSDDAACQSAKICLGKLRDRFANRFVANFGDHELGKASLGGGLGGLRLASHRRACAELALQHFWQVTVENYVLLGVSSPLIAFPAFEPETLSHERAEWRQLRDEHLESIRAAFTRLKASQRVLLFCHDPTALPFLGREEVVRSRLSQVERTFIGHLHSPFVLRLSTLLAGIPQIGFVGITARRSSAALREARHWKAFNLTLCPSLTGIQLLKDGGYYTAVIDPTARKPAVVSLNRFQW